MRLFVPRRTCECAFAPLVRLGVLVGVLLVGAAPAQALDPGLRLSLDYETDTELEGCPSGAEFKAGIVRRLHGDPFREPASRRMVVRISSRDAARRQDARIEGRVEWHDAEDHWEGERTFLSRSDSCAELARAMELAITIQIQLLGPTPVEPVVNVPPETPVEAPPPPPPVEAPPPVVPPPPPAEPWLTLDVGAGLLSDVGRIPVSGAPHLALAVGHPFETSVRLGFTGFGSSAKVSGLEGEARLDRYLVLLEAVRFFLPGRRLQPSVALGAGVQSVHVEGRSTAPTVVQAHAGQATSGVAVASAGLSLAITSRFALFLEAQGFLFRPVVTVLVGSSEAARLEGAAVFVHAGLLARF